MSEPLDDVTGRPGAAPATEPAALAPWEAEPEPLGVPVEPTGHAAVDAALGRLAVLDGVPASAHAAVYEDVHRSLTGVLTALDQPDGAHRPHQRTGPDEADSTARS